MIKSDNPFPNPRDTPTTSEGIIAVGDDLSPDTLLHAYRSGIFPWPMDGAPLCWFCPPERAVLDFDEIHIPRSLKKEMKRRQYQVTVDHAFTEVMKNCAKTPRPGQDGTWITAQMVRAYTKLHQLGHAHSVEIWEAEQLVGGIYGVDPGGAFAGESMFYLKPYASKFALLSLIDHLREKGLTWLDIQVMTPHMEALGAKEIDRNEFLDRLDQALERRIQLFAVGKSKRD